VPLIGSGEEAARAVRACRYPPQGSRSYGPARAQLVLGSDATEDLAAGALCIVMVETREGLDRLEEIAATPGLDGIYIGPSDLSLALGLAPPALGTPELETAIVRIREVSHAHGLLAGMHCADGTAARARAAEGFDLVTVAVDSAVYSAAVAGELAAARSPG
jgi:4-hydroxy-2-oxoheptanedioate aldolase